MKRNSILMLLMWTLALMFIGLACDNMPLSTNTTEPSIQIVLGDLRQVAEDSWLAQLLPQNAAKTTKPRISGQNLMHSLAINEVKILVLDMTQWESEEQFRQAWESMNQTALIDTSNWDDERDFWDNALRLFQSYIGDQYRFAGEFTLEIEKSTVANGTINASPGLNYFLIGLREQRITQFWFERFFIVSENEELNNICIGCGRPVVEISSPSSGSALTTNVVSVVGTIEQDSTIVQDAISTARLIVNGFSQTIRVTNGRFVNPAVLAAGLNTIVVQARNSDGIGTDTVLVEFQGQPAAMRATLTWDTDATDMDLLLTNPNGEVCSLTDPNIGGMMLDVDDVDGFGPENISVNQPITGEYTITVRNFSADAGIGTTVSVHIFKNESVSETVRYTFSTAPDTSWQISWP